MINAGNGRITMVMAWTIGYHTQYISNLTLYGYTMIYYDIL